VEEGTLAARIYDELVERVYTSKTMGAQVMMLIAHGPQQTQELQLHRPEKCYPANGYLISGSAEIQLPLGGGATLPARRMIADTRDSRENVIYWTRIGEELPASARQQSSMRLSNVLHGYIPDGVLARFSIVSPDTKQAMAIISAFIPALLRSVAPDDRAALIGTRRATALTAAGLSRT
jgi:EpsI family protein